MADAIDPSLQSLPTTTPTATTNTATTTSAPPTYNIAPAPLRYDQQFAPQQQQNPNSNVGNYPSASPSNPYYGGYPTPQTHTPLPPSTGAHSIASAGASNQASPQDATAQYQRIAQDTIDNSHVSDGNDAPGGGDDAKRPRACEACRGLKVRCDQDPTHPDLPCRRCAKAGRQCVITAPSRKRQKKADSRVAELEKKLDHLTNVLQQQQQGGQLYVSQYSQAPPAEMQGRGYAPPAQHFQQYAQQQEPTHEASSMQPPSKRRRTDDMAPEMSGVGGEAPAPGSSSRYDARSQSEQDISTRLQELNREFDPHPDGTRHLIDTPSGSFLDRIHALVSPPLGVQLFDRYVEQLAPHMPAVVFPPGTGAEHVSRQTPILYTSILSAAAYGVVHSDVAKQLTDEAIKAVADCVVVNGAKSIELIQAMQVLALWYKLPENAQQTNFYQIIHMAAVMAIDLGLGKRFNPAKLRRGFAGNGETAPGGPQPTNSDTIEARRAWLGCYYMCASASMVLRRPNLVRWTKYMEESVEILETSSEALQTDQLFCQHIKIQHICEEVSVQFLMDDNTAIISITDPKVTYALKVLENDLKEWGRKLPPSLKSHPSLKFFEHVASLYLHEIALHFNHNIEDFRLPFTEESLKSVNNTSEKLTQNQISALDACRTSAQGVLECMLGFDTETIKALPMLIFFVRCTYALVILIKLHVAVTTAGSEIGKAMSTEDINVDRYLDGLIDKLVNMPNNSSSEENVKPHPKVVRILSLLREWFMKHKQSIAAQSRGEAPPSSVQQTDQHGQTPLHLLAQTATDAKQEQKGASHGDGQAWTFNSPFPMEYNAPTQPGTSQAQFASSQQGGSYQPGSGGFEGNFAADFDPHNPWLWGSNFQQAMDLSLADMSGVTGGGIDGLFYGNGPVAYGWQGDAQQ